LPHYDAITSIKTIWDRYNRAVAEQVWHHFDEQNQVKARSKIDRSTARCTNTLCSTETLSEPEDLPRSNLVTISVNKSMLRAIGNESGR
jgi:hypothetical protein